MNELNRKILEYKKQSPNFLQHFMSPDLVDRTSKVCFTSDLSV
jgi:hypothetical protein